MKLFNIERGVYPFVEGDSNTIDVDGYHVISSEMITRPSMQEAIEYVRTKYKTDIGIGMDEVHKHFIRLYLHVTDKKISMETIEIHEGKMHDEYGFGKEEFHSFNEDGEI